MKWGYESASYSIYELGKCSSWISPEKLQEETKQKKCLYHRESIPYDLTSEVEGFFSIIRLGRRSVHRIACKEDKFIPWITIVCESRDMPTLSP